MVFVKTKLSAFNDIEEVLMRYFSRLAWSCWTQLIIIIVVLIVVVVLVVHVLKRLVLSALVEAARQDGLVDRWDVVVVARGVTGDFLCENRNFLFSLFWTKVGQIGQNRSKKFSCF